MTTWGDSQEAFDEAAPWFGRLVADAQGRWDDLALGDWTVRDLVGHTSRALITVESYLGGTPSSVDVTSPVEYFQLALASIGDPAAVTQRARAAGTSLGDDPAQAVRDIVERVTSLIRGTAEDALVATPVGGMLLCDYLPTRTFELTVHTCDLAVALGIEAQVPQMAATESLRLVGDLAVNTGQVPPLLRAATGRSGLPHGFSVL